MPASNGYVSAPVSIADVRTALGEASNDLGTLCKSAKINKWSQCKPVRNAELGQLTASQFKLTGTVTENGIAYTTKYGLRCSAPSDLRQAHSCDYKHYKPRGSAASPAEPYRLTDYNTYTHTGKPEIMGEVYNATPLDPTYDSAELSLRVNGYDSNWEPVASNHAVSLAELAGFTSLGSCYVCCLLSGSGSNSGKNYAICCYNRQYELQTPVKYNGAVWVTFYAPLSTLPAAALGGGTHAATFMLVQGDNALFKPQTAWAEWTEISAGLVLSATWITIPGAVGISLTFETASDMVFIIGVAAARRMLASGKYEYQVQMTWKFNTDTSTGGVAAGQTRELTIRLTIGNVVLYDNTSTFTVDDSERTVRGVSVPIQIAIENSKKASGTIIYGSTSKSKDCDVAIWS